MRLLLGSEIALFAPQIAEKSQIADETGQTRFILAASAAAEAFCGQKLDMQPHYNEEIALDLNYTGLLRYTPFVEWLEEEGQISYMGSVNPTSILLSDFEVLTSGVIRNLTARPSGIYEGGQWVGEGPSSADSPYASTRSQYYPGNSQLVADNSKPWIMRASYLAGWFVERNVAEAESSGSNTVELDDVTGITKAREFYFETDPENESGVDRTVTDVNPTTKVVTFEPALEAAVSEGDKFRMIDKSVRSACAEIIADMITYPPNTKDYSRGLARGDIFNRWIRSDGFMIPQLAAVKLAPYRRK